MTSTWRWPPLRSAILSLRIRRFTITGSIRSNDLGAAKGSVLKEITDRLGLFRKDGKTRKDMNRHSRNTYQALFRQAAEFYRLYKEELNPQQKHMLHAFVKMKDENRFRKILTIFRYGFTFNRLHRTIGECAFI
jgi:hypothetical protein